MSSENIQNFADGGGEQQASDKPDYGEAKAGTAETNEVIFGSEIMEKNAATLQELLDRYGIIDSIIVPGVLDIAEKKCFPLSEKIGIVVEFLNGKFSGKDSAEWNE